MVHSRLRLVVIAVAATVACLLRLAPAQAAPAAHLRSGHDEKEGEKASSIGGIRKLTAAEVHELVQARRAAPGTSDIRIGTGHIYVSRA
jgi:hypothetical protein